MITEANLPHEIAESGVDNIAVSTFVDISVDVTNITSEPKIQITLLILRRGGLPKLTPVYQQALEFQT